MTDELKSTSPKPDQSVYIHALGVTQLSMPLFVGSTDKEEGQSAFVARPACEVTPLINGAAAFGELEKAIRGATRSIDYITWGFDPSMRFSDGGASIGEVLLKRLDECKTLEVRILVWYGGYFSSIAYGAIGDTGLTDQGGLSRTANLPRL